MELKEGMYVRTCEYGIGKVEICNCVMCQERGYLEPRVVFKNHTEYITNKETEELYAKIADNSIINLIKIGDYVNDCLVTNLRSSVNEFLGGHPKQVGIIKKSNSYNECEFMWIDESQIKFIVTKEQFEAMSYKVGE